MADTRTGNRQPATGNAKCGMRLGDDIAERLIGLAVVAIRLGSRLTRDAAGRHVVSQLIRSATGGGANYEEARAAESRDDFIHKIGIAAKEVRETVYWLELIRRSLRTDVDVASAIREASELAAILGASARTARARAPSRK